MRMDTDCEAARSPTEGVAFSLAHTTSGFFLFPPFSSGSPLQRNGASNAEAGLI